VSEPTESRGWRGTSPTLRHLFACLLLVALTAGTFLNTLRNQFVSFDDWNLIEENQRIRSLSLRSVGRMLVMKDPRSHAWLPLRELSYALDYRLWGGLKPIGFHLTNLLLHTANAVLAYGVLVWLLRRPWLACLGAAAFAVHPVQVESVAWASGRRDVLYGLFFLLAFLTFVTHEKHSGRRRWVLYGLSLFFLAAALLSKAAAMSLPACLVLAVLVSEEGERDFWERLLATAPHWALAVGLAAVHLRVAHDAGVVKGQAFSSCLANVPYVFALYWRLLFFPVHLATPHGEGTLSWAADGTLIGLLAALTAGVVAAAWWAAPRRSLAVFCIAWWFVLLLPVAHFVPLSALIAERYLYLPMLGASGFAAGLLGSLMTTRWRKAVVGCCAIIVLALLAAAAHKRNFAWADSRAFWQDGVAKWPSTPVMRIGLATAYVDALDYERAWEQYMMVEPHLRGRAVSSDPEHVDLVHRGLKGFYDQLARRRESQGRHASALEAYETMVRLLQDEKKAEPWVLLAKAYERRGVKDKAREALLAAKKAEPAHAGLDDLLKRLDQAPPAPRE